MSAKQELLRRLDALAERQRQRNPEQRPRAVFVRTVSGDDTDVHTEAAKQLGRPLQPDDTLIVLQRITAADVGRGMVG